MDLQIRIALARPLSAELQLEVRRLMARLRAGRVLVGGKVAQRRVQRGRDDEHLGPRAFAELADPGEQLDAADGLVRDDEDPALPRPRAADWSHLILHGVLP